MDLKALRTGQIPVHLENVVLLIQWSQQCPRLDAQDGVGQLVHLGIIGATHDMVGRDFTWVAQAYRLHQFFEGMHVLR